MNRCRWYPHDPWRVQVAAAWRELEEETGLTPSRGGLKLVRAGLPVTLRDTIKGKPKQICVHPFLFECGVGAGAGDGAGTGAGTGAGAGAGAGGTPSLKLDDPGMSTCTSKSTMDTPVEVRMCREHQCMEWVEPLQIVRRDWQGSTVPGCVGLLGCRL